MNYIDIENEQLKELMKDEHTVLLDVRTKDEFEERSIDGSINIPLHDLMYDIDEIEEFKDKKVIVYCRSGHRSITACNLLELEGFNNIYNLKYGILNYK
ncbi:rhodanese-like domain-containing protein [Paraclostridium ghonii]|uniref:Rhodanese-related sulfurtransferase n=1 Tax=Paraclostridium ghonii TaxID=29358 RepID=A0ABU0MY15_9FIRM|nr:rhodanese-like domain-containing protein [Paeniclostridium ghonii]MCM0167385.1 rhodanese-like domain-containing protein [Paeniclostridium ghonii]MDQ0555731.1 rhodanese-related sulfurtransferase [Paeniclostridium ghonii]